MSSLLKTEETGMKHEN